MHGTNRRRIYALASWTIELKTRGWFIKKTDSDEPFKGHYSSETSACLMVARQLKRELLKRDRLPT